MPPDTIVVMVQTTQKLGQQHITPWFTKPGAGHAAQFYADQRSLGMCALEYVYRGLVHREVCIVIATPEKLIALQKGLRRLGVDISTALADGRYITYDAEELLSGFMNDRELDGERFNAAMTMLLRHVAGGRYSVRVFGEMAALLRQQRNSVALLQLEHALESLQSNYRFSLYCAYPISDERSEYAEMHQKIQQTHDHVFYC